MKDYLKVYILLYKRSWIAYLLYTRTLRTLQSAIIINTVTAHLAKARRLSAAQQEYSTL